MQDSRRTGSHVSLEEGQAKGDVRAESGTRGCNIMPCQFQAMTSSSLFEERVR
jgi:hypothetical protein